MESSDDAKLNHPSHRGNMLKFCRPTKPLGVRTLYSSRAVLIFQRNVPNPASSQQKGPIHENGSLLADKYGNHPILKRIPRLLRPYTTRFIDAPVSHVTAFLILHEITAIIPLVGVWYVLHNYPDLLLIGSLDLPSWAIEKGTKIIDKTMKDWNFGDISLSEKYRFIREGAYAYVIVKGLFPVRLAVSLLGMPLFAKWFVLPITSIFSRKPTPKQISGKPVQVNEAAIQTHNAKKVNKPRL